ncbi:MULTISPECIES: sensor domain-containing protein [unclassified Janthinobacterium]|uniref:sensor domain-containing protein n=1 Tax=unclassified Janthinobacterium TaxID=2610881 RepID=UPI0003469A37|nr:MULTISPECIES: EAL domain-containing protein [unclassified Janthinobacterium]MEC5160246.1 diguanylate cyclase (GGDEF)-like protein/PAS domain S-box-containing protein [Janthinobacterium sp. CG_S6]
MISPRDFPSVAFSLNAAGRITSWNSACQRLLGYTDADILLRPLASILPDVDPRACGGYLAAARSHSKSVETSIVVADGQRCPFNLTLAPQSGKGGKFHSFCVIVTPAAPCGEESEHDLIGRTPLKEMVDFLAGTFHVVNQSGRLVMWNKRVEQASQRSAEELLTFDVLKLFSDADRGAVAEKLQAVFEHDGDEAVEASLVARDGSSRPYLFSGSRFKVGERHYLCGMGLDISELRRQQEQLRLRERALHASGNGIVITRCAGRDNPIEYVNLAFERITGYAAAEVIGRDPRFMTAPGLDEAERNTLRLAVAAREESHVIFRNQRKDGELFWNDLTITPVLDEQGRATHFIGVVNDVTANIHRTSHLEHALNHDLLTGLATRSLLWDRLDKALHLAQRNKTLVATVLVDLDNFKDINDTLGHDAGDEVLRVVARRLQSSVRDTDTVARLGGDEFVLVLDNQPSLRFTLRMIERLRHDMAKAALVCGKQIEIGTSMGVSIFPHDGSTVLELIQAADVAMYHAKAAGRNDVHFFSAEMKLTSEAKNKLEASMRIAIDRDEMFLVLQPRICLKTGAILGAEALLRWRHPEQGVLLPEAFLTEAEENGLIVPLGEWVFDSICTILQRLNALGYQQLVLSMNVSFRELSQKNFATLIGKKLHDSHLPPGMFELEIKEAYLLRNPQLAKEVFEEIRKMGIKLTIDDFGAGVSSLSNLQKLTINHLKIPKSFIASITEHGLDGVMAKTMIGIGHNMSIDVIAEGVETSSQLNFLKANNCDEMQGNYFSEPVSLASFEQMLGNAAK